jgi:carbon-monoxide dehydrogenase large subunit
MAGSAAVTAARVVVDEALALAAEALEIHTADLVWQQGAAHAKGVPGVGMGLAEIAAYGARSGRPLQHTSYFEAAGLHAANGTHAAVVEVDPATGIVEFLRYVVVHDCGRMLNPALVEGQILGGLAQGIGGCLSEQLVYSEDGQPLTTSFMDYLLPTAADMPEVEIHHLESHSPHNPLGVKGAGEGGILPVYALVAAAVEDAVGSPVENLPLSMELIRRFAGTMD